MKYMYYEIGKQPREIETEGVMKEEQLQQLLQIHDGQDVAFTLLKNGHVLCVNAEALIMNLPNNPAFTEADFSVGLDSLLRGNILEGTIDADGEFAGIE